MFMTVLQYKFTYENLLISKKHFPATKTLFFQKHKHKCLVLLSPQNIQNTQTGVNRYLVHILNF